MSARTDTTSRMVWVLFLAGPVIWFAHFMAVYLVAEAGCAAGGFDTHLLGLPILSFVTVVATVVAAAATLFLAERARRRWRTRRGDDFDWMAGDEGNPGLALAGFLLGVTFAVAILFVGVPAAFLDPC